MDTDSTQPFSEEIKQYIQILWHWAWLIILATVLAGVAAFVTSQLSTPIFQAKTTLLINEAPSSQTSEYTALLTSERLARTYSELLPKRPVLDEVIVRLAYNHGESVKRPRP